MSAAGPRDRRRGFSLLEVSIAVGIFSGITVMSLMTLVEGSSSTSLLTADTELRQRANDLLEQLANDLRSTRTGAGAVSVTASPTSNQISFFKITSATHAGAVYASQPTTYSWNPQEATKTNLRDSRVKYVTPSPATSNTIRTAFLSGEIESFTISPTSGWTASAAQTFDFTVVLRRDNVVKRETGNLKGSVWVRATARITVPKG